MGLREEFKKTVKNRFLAGVLVIVPLFTAIAILKFAVESIDNFISPYVLKIVGEEFSYPLIGLGVTLMLIMLAGIFTSNFIGKKIYGKWEMLLLKIPLFSTLYSAAKQFIEGVAIPNNKTFEKVVMVEYPRRGIYVMGFLANRITIHNSKGETELWSVFLPSSPTPFTGIAVLFPPEDVKTLDMNVEQGVRFFVSGSASAPKHIRELEMLSNLAEPDQSSTIEV